MIRTIENKLHHLKELDFIERTLYGEVISPEIFYQKLRDFIFKTPEIDLSSKNYLTVEEVEIIDYGIKDIVYDKLDDYKGWLIRAYVIGRFLAESDKQATIFDLTEFNSMPFTVQQAVKKYDLNIAEAKAMTQAMEKAGVNLTNTTTATIQQVKQCLVESISHGESGRGMEKRLRDLIEDDAGELNRDWLRVSIYETNKAFNDGYLSRLSDGDYVIGISMPDACPICMDLINNKLYKVTTTPPPSYSDLIGEEYEKIAKIWDNYVWIGKDNIGRSGAKRKRILSSGGNSADNLRDRAHHEQAMPAIPQHPYCFKAGTKVRMSNGILQSIETINVGDKVISHRNKVQKVLGRSEREYTGNFNRLELSNGQIIEATELHPLLIKRGEEYFWAEIKEIRQGDSLVKIKPKIMPRKETIEDEYTNQGESINSKRVNLSDKNFEFIEVINNSQYQDKCKVYNIEVNTDHSYLVEDIVVKNCRCRWNSFNPEYQWIDENENVRLIIEDRDAHREFYNRVILGME